MNKTLILLVFLYCISIVACEKDRPEWINTDADSPTQVSAVGFGDTKLDAFASALGELSRKIDSKVESVDRSHEDETSGSTYAKAVTRTVSSISFGKVKVETLSKVFTEEKGSAGDTELTDISQGTYKISLGDSLKSYEIKYFFEMSTTNKDKKFYDYIEAKANNLTFIDLINELKNFGLKMKTYEAEDEYNVLLIYKIGNVNK